MHVQFWSENLGNLDIAGTILLKCNRKNRCECKLDSSGFGYGPVAGSCVHGKEPLGSVRGGEFLD
jgi:hypothetical protein